MSEEKKAEKAVEGARATGGGGAAPDPEDEDLSLLLDSALSDFGKAGASAGPEPGAPVIDQHMAQLAAQEFQNMLKQLAEVQKAVLDQNKAPQPVDGAALGPIAAAAAAAGLTDASAMPSVVGQVPGDGGPPISAEEEAAFAENLLKNLQGLADKAQKVTDAKGEDEFLAAMQDMHNNDSYTNEFLPFMQGLMGSLLSKDMMYPSLKEMVEKYPDWLEKNKDTISAEDAERYNVQLGLMKEAVAEYDSEAEGESEEAAAARFEKLIVVMQKMQMCGHPPEELVGSLPNGWAMSESGLPQVTDTSAAAENCSIM